MSNPLQPLSGGDPARASLDLSKIRHDLRTPINHILGYCEMLQEEEIPSDFQPDLQKIRTGGKQLLSLITEYFDEETFEGKQLDLHQLSHELRTPVNHIVGYTELLEEIAEERGLLNLLADLEKIRTAAHTWLGLMEEYLVAPHTPGTGGEPGSPATANPVLLQPGISYASPVLRGADPRPVEHGRLLVVDDDAANREILARRLARLGYQVVAAASGIEALRRLRTEPPDLVLLDMVMPGLDGYQVLSKIKSDPALAEIPVVMISALDQENSVARCIEAGAADYVPKPFNSVLLRARIGASLEQKRLRERQRQVYQALLKSQKLLAGELGEAAAYVRSLLPAPLSGAVEAEWCFEPSAQLGGDAFGYHWLEPDCLAIYLIDVCGHGVGAALLSVSVLNALRSQNLGAVDFKDPASVLAALNHNFPMEAQHNLFFSAWYGVYQLSTRTLVYGSGGHPPALLIEPVAPDQSRLVPLRTEAPAVGCLPGAPYASATQFVARGSRLLVLTDGVYEIYGDAGRVGTWDAFLASLADPAILALRPAARLARARAQRGASALEDDFSLLELRFP